MVSNQRAAACSLWSPIMAVSTSSSIARNTFFDEHATFSLREREREERQEGSLWKRGICAKPLLPGAF